MDDNFKAEGAEEIERLHAQLAGESETAENHNKNNAAPDREDRNQVGGEVDSPEAGFLGDVVECEENLRRLLAAHADGVRRNTAKELAPIYAVEPNLVCRIAENAGMSDSLQKLLSHHSAKILSKYKAAKYVSDGGAIVYGILSYIAEREETKRDIAALLKKHSPANGAKRDSSTAGLTDFPAHETKPVSTLNMERPPIPKIST